MRDRGAPPRQAAESLWRFSLALYARPDVATALIGLQDRVGCDVNLVLFALWLGATRAELLDAEMLVAAAAASAPLNTGVVHPLRRLRRELKDVAGGDIRALRRRVLNLELAAERQVLHRLAAAPPRGRRVAGMRPLAVALANLALCLGEAAMSTEAETVRRALAAMMRAG
jgi:uncharacterized protein (TIGR02444 family)